MERNASQRNESVERVWIDCVSIDTSLNSRIYSIPLWKIKPERSQTPPRCLLVHLNVHFIYAPVKIIRLDVVVMRSKVGSIGTKRRSKPCHGDSRVSCWNLRQRRLLSSGIADRLRNYLWLIVSFHSLACSLDNCCYLYRRKQRNVETYESLRNITENAKSVIFWIASLSFYCSL